MNPFTDRSVRHQRECASPDSVLLEYILPFIRSASMAGKLATSKSERLTGGVAQRRRNNKSGRSARSAPQSVSAKWECTLLAGRARRSRTPARGRCRNDLAARNDEHQQPQRTSPPELDALRDLLRTALTNGTPTHVKAVLQAMIDGIRVDARDHIEQRSAYQRFALTPPTWSQPGSNRRPPACKAGALPAELWPQSPILRALSVARRPRRRSMERLWKRPDADGAVARSGP